MHRSARTRLLLALTLTAAWAGCGSTEELAGSQFPIESGVASMAFAATGALVYNREKVVCSASLVARDRILSAGHCFMDATAEKIQKLEFVVGYDWQNATVRAPIDRVITHPQFDRSRWPFEHDVAVGLLAQPIDEVKPAMLFTSDAQLLIGERVTLVGYGRSEQRDDIGLRRQTDVEIAEVLDSDWRYAFAGSGACNGDSGGPAYAKIDGTWRQIGVTSGGDGDGCRVDGLYTRLDIHTPWLEQQGVPVQTIRDVICSERQDGVCDGLCEIDADCEKLMCGNEACPPIQSAPLPQDNSMGGNNSSQQSQQTPGGMMGMMMQMMQMFQQMCPMCMPGGSSQPSSGGSTPSGGGGTPSSSPSCPADWEINPATGQCTPPCPTGWVRDAQGFCQPAATSQSACPAGWVEDDYGWCQPECRYVTRAVVGQDCVYTDQFSGTQCYSTPLRCDSTSCWCVY